MLKQKEAEGVIEVKGFLPYDELITLLSNSRIFINPPGEMTGVSTKNIMSMSHGIPVVSTRHGIRGLGLDPLERRREALEALGADVGEQPFRGSERLLRAS